MCLDPRPGERTAGTHIAVIHRAQQRPVDEHCGRAIGTPRSPSDLLGVADHGHAVLDMPRPPSVVHRVPPFRNPSVSTLRQF